MSIERQTVHALKWSGMAKLSGQLVSWVSTLIVLRLLAPEDYGLMAIVTVIISILAGLAEFGLGASLVQAPILDQKDVSRVSGLAVSINLGAFVLVELMAPLTALAFNDDRMTALIRVAAIHFLLNAFATVPDALARREMDFRRLAWIEVIAVSISALATLLLAYLGAGVWALVLGSLLQALIRMLLLVRHGIARPNFSLRGVGSFLRFGGAVTLSNLSWQLVYQSDVLIAGGRLSSGSVGLYSLSLHLATLPMQKIMGTVNQVAFPAVSRLQADRERLRSRLLAAARLMTVFSTSVMWGMSCVSPELISVALGEKWVPAIFPLQVICLIVPMRMLSAVFSSAVKGIGRAGLDLRNSIISAVVLPTSFYVGTHWGVNGLAMSWLVAIPLVFILNFGRMISALEIKVLDVMRAVWAPVIAGIAMYAGVTALRLGLEPYTIDVLRLPVLVLAGVVVYLTILQLVCPAIRTEVIQILRAARS